MWEEVFNASNSVIGQSKKFSFLVMKDLPNPNIHTMLARLQSYTEVMDKIIQNVAILDVEHDEVRLILNAREQLRKLERLAKALTDDNEEEYNICIEALEKQGAF
jgi:hypothetical protein